MSADATNTATPAPRTDPPVRRRRWRPLRSLVLGLLALVLLAVLLLTWLLKTQSGARFALARASGVLNQALTVEQVDGTLADGLRLAGLSYVTETLGVALDRAQVRVDLMALTGRTLHVTQLDLGTLTVTLPLRDEPAEPSALALPSIALPLDVVIDRLDIAALTIINGEQPVPLGAVAFEAALRDGTLRITTLELGPEQWRVATRGELTPSGDWPLAIALNWRLPQQPWQGEATLGGTLAELDVEHALQGNDLRVTTNGTVQLLGRVSPAFDVEHRCLAECVFGNVTLREPRVQQKGTADDYALEASVTLDMAPLTPTRIALAGTGSTERLKIASLTADGDSLVVRSSGDVAWSPQLDYRLSGDFSRLNAALLHSTLAGRVRGQFEVSGVDTTGNVATLRKVTGELNGFPLAARATLRRDGKNLAGEALRITLGDNLLAGFARWQDGALGADLTLDAPKLEQILPELGGALAGTVQADGALTALRLKAELTGQTLAWRDNVAERVTLNLTTSGAQTARGQLAITGVATATRDLGDATVEFDGPLTDLPLRAAVVSAGQTLTLDVNVALAPNDVHGTVRQGAVDIDALGEWRIAEAFAFAWTPAAFTVEAQRWEAGDAALRLEPLTLAGDALELGATLTKMPLAPLNPFLPRNIRIGGSVDATLALAREGELWRGNIDWQQQDTQLSAQADGTTVTVQFPVVQVQGELNEPEGRLTLALNGDYDTSGSGDFALRNDNGVTRVVGQGRLDIRKLNWLGPFIPGVQKLAGALELEVSADGPLAQPGLRGRVALRDAAATLPQLGVRLEDVDLAGAGAADGTIELQGGATSAGGRLAIDGRIEQALSTSRKISLNVRGDDIQVVDQQDYKLWMSPDLTLTVSDEGAQIGGSIAVPRADIQIRELPESAVSRSADVEVVGREVKQRAAMPVSGEIAVSVGDEVRFAAFGLTSEVVGDVELSLDPGRPPRLDGRLSLANGQFAAYGQKLDVQKGDLIYSGSLDNPTLDVIATRRITGTGNGDVLAGVRVSGPARSPTIDVYSEPDMPPTDALAYLVLGRASLESGGADGALLSRAALGLGLRGSSAFTAGIASGLGLDEFTVRGGDTLDATELVAGKQLNERLFVRYSFGVFSELGALLINYRLTDHLSLEAGAAASQSLDLLYSIKK